MFKSNQTPIVVAIFALATILVVGTFAMNPNNQNALAKEKSESALQTLPQEQETGQSSDVFSENGSSTASGNNVELSFNLNEGQNALGQQ